MPYNFNNILPENLISLAKKKPSTPAAIVSGHQNITMESVKEAYDLNLIVPFFIGEKEKSQNKKNVV